MSECRNKGKPSQWFPYVFIYDYQASTDDSQDAGKSIIYQHPKNTPAHVRISVSSQIAGVTQFCTASFCRPSVIKTEWSYIALKYYDRYHLVVCGPTLDWVNSRVRCVADFLESSIGDFQCLWNECKQIDQLFHSRLSAHMDAITCKVFKETQRDDYESASSPLSSTVSSMISPISELQYDLETDSLMTSSEMTSHDPPDFDASRLMRPILFNEISNPTQDIDFYDRELAAIPSLSLPKSGGGVFLKAQELIEACLYQPGVLGGLTSFQQKTLSSQIDGTVWQVLTTFENGNKDKGILSTTAVDFQLPNGVTLHSIYIKNQTLRNLMKKVPKHLCKKTKKKTLSNVVQSGEMNCLRNALHNKSLHSYPPHIPPLISANDASPPPTQDLSVKRPIDPLLLCSKLSRNSGLLSDGRPSRSLPGSPRKIRVSTMLPDVGNNSPQLRYKVLSSKMPKPVLSTHNTPKRLPSHANHKKGFMEPESANGKNYRCSSLNAPALKRKDYFINTENKPRDLVSQSTQVTTPSKANELDIKNTKNKLNLQFAPNSIYRPSDDSESKIFRELNGTTKETNNNQVLNKAYEVSSDEDEISKSEDSDISVLELNSLIQTKDTVDRLFRQAVKPITPPSQNEPQTPLTFDAVTPAFPEADTPYISVIVYQHTLKDTKVTLLIDQQSGRDPTTIHDLHRLTSKGLPSLNSSILRALEISADLQGDAFLRKSFSVLSGVDVNSLNARLLVEAHRDFKANPNIMELTFKNKDCVVWGNRLCSTETFYQCEGVDRAGLPIPSDAMARIPHKARKALERDHTITIL